MHLPKRLVPARRTTRAFALIAVLLATWFSWTYVPYLTEEGDESVASRTVNWARDNRLSWAVNKLEQIASAKAPSTKPASELSLAEPAPTTLPMGTTAPTAPIDAPAPLQPVVLPALKSEGQWRPVSYAGGSPAVWATSLRPLRKYPSVTATYAVIDQTHLRGAMFNGSKLPGGTWKNGSKVPKALQNDLVVAFNGGFRFEHAPGSGYVTEGRTVRKPSRGQATIVVTSDGIVRMGEWGTDIDPAGSYLSVRQNLPMLVQNGKSRGSTGLIWGLDGEGLRYVVRSALCELADDRLMFVIAHRVDGVMLGQILESAGCVRGMQLDINGNWPSLYTFSEGQPQRLDRKVNAPNGRYLNGSSKDFIAFFDRSTLPPNALPSR